MATPAPNGSKKTPKRLRPSIKKDPIHPTDYNRYTLPWACEDCVHFDSEEVRCTLGYSCEPHLRAEQKRQYDLSGAMALCRFQEID